MYSYIKYEAGIIPIEFGEYSLPTFQSVCGGGALNSTILQICRPELHLRMLTLQGEHAEAGNGIFASRKDLTSPYASHACLEGQACHPPPATPFTTKTGIH